MESLSRLFQEVPDFGGILLYAVIVAILFFGVVIGRYMIRGAVNRKVKSIHTEGLDLGDLSTMGKRGLLTDEELKKIRKRFAERQLEETRQKETGLDAKSLLLAIEADPSRATSLLPPSSEHARQANEGLKKSGGVSVEEQLRAQLGEAAPAAPVEPPRAAPQPAPSSQLPPPRPAAAQAQIPPAPRPAAEKKSGAGLDLDTMLAQGLISRREYELLIARVKKATGGE